MSVPVAGSYGGLPLVPQSFGRDAQLPGDLDWTDTRLQEPFHFEALEANGGPNAPEMDSIICNSSNSG